MGGCVSAHWLHRLGLGVSTESKDLGLPQLASNISLFLGSMVGNSIRLHRWKLRPLMWLRYLLQYIGSIRLNLSCSVRLCLYHFHA